MRKARGAATDGAARSGGGGAEEAGGGGEGGGRGGGGGAERRGGGEEAAARRTPSAAPPRGRWRPSREAALAARKAEKEAQKVLRERLAQVRRGGRPRRRRRRQPRRRRAGGTAPPAAGLDGAALVARRVSHRHDAGGEDHPVGATRVQASRRTRAWPRARAAVAVGGGQYREAARPSEHQFGGGGGFGRSGAGARAAFRVALSRPPRQADRRAGGSHDGADWLSGAPAAAPPRRRRRRASRRPVSPGRRRLGA